MKLTVSERIKLNDILPQIQSFVVKKLLRKFSESLSFTEKEHALLRFMYEYECPNCHETVGASIPIKCGTCNVYMEATGKINWNPQGDLETGRKDIFIGEKVKEIIVAELKALDDAKQLDDVLTDLYERFVVEEAEEKE